MESISPKLLHQLACAYFNAKTVSLTPLKGDGSDRQIYLINNPLQPEHTVVGVLHAKLQENKDFFQITAKMREAGIAVPEIFRIDDSGQAYLLQYLGDSNLGQRIDRWLEQSDRSKIVAAYRLVLPALVKMQNELTPLLWEFLRGKSMGRQEFAGDLAYFQRDFIKRFGFGDLLTSALLQELNLQLVDRLAAIPPRVFVYRDFQSRNIMWLQDVPWFIDYQSAYLGSRYYDLASLLFASKSGLDDAAREELLKRYFVIANLPIGLDEYRSCFFLFVLMRRLRSLGSYGFLAMEKGKTGFLAHIKPTLTELQLLFNEKAELKEFRRTAGLIEILRERWQETESQIR